MLSSIFYSTDFIFEVIKKIHQIFNVILYLTLDDFYSLVRHIFIAKNYVVKFVLIGQVVYDFSQSRYNRHSMLDLLKNFMNMSAMTTNHYC